MAGRTWCVAPRKPLFFRRRAPRLPRLRRRQRVGRGAPLPANPCSFVAGHHVFRGHGAGNGAGRIGSAGAGSAWLDRRGWTGARGNRPDVVRCSPQTLIPSSPSTTSSGAMAPAAGRTWCAAPRKPLFLRHRAPRLPGPRRRRRAGRGAPLPANPYSFVAEHHVFRGQSAGNGSDVVRRSPQTLIPSSPGTTSSGAKAPATGLAGLDRRGRGRRGWTGVVGPARGVTGRTWCVAPRKPLFLRRRAPRLPNQRRRRRAGRGAPRPANPYSFVAGHHVFQVQGAGGGPDVVLPVPQTLITSSSSTTSSGDKATATGRTWCAAHRKPLFLRRRAPRLPGPWRRRRTRRGAPLPANPYSFVAEHHVFRGRGAGNRTDVVRRSPQTLIPSSPGTTSSEAKAPMLA